MKKELKTAFLDTLPVMAGYLVLGMGFGVLLESKGFGVLWAFCMSFFVYAGSMQYLAVSMLAPGVSLVSAAVTTLMVNARHLFYGISMVDKYKNTGKIKPYIIFALTDETYSLVCDGNHTNAYYLLVSLFNHFYWVMGSVLGSLIGSLLNFDTNGIDFALTALFLTVFTEQWISQKRHRYAVIGVIASVVCLICFGKDNFLIPSMALIAAALLILRKKEEECDE